MKTTPASGTAGAPAPMPYNEAENPRHEASQAELYHLLMQAPVAIVIFSGPQYVVELANDLYLDIVGKRREQLLHKPVFEAIPEAAGQGFIEILNNIRATGVAFKLTEHKTGIERDGRAETAYLNIVYQPVREAGGAVSKIMILVTDVTEQVAARKKVEESAEQLRVALEGGELGTYDYYPQTGVMHWSQRSGELFGLQPDALVDYDVFLRGLHPNDKERTQAALRNAMDPANGGGYDDEYRTIGIGDGKLRWVRSKGKISFDADGHPMRLTGVMQDITQQKENLRSLQLQSLVLEQMDEGVSVSDEAGIILLTNAAEDRMFGYEAGGLVGKHVTVQNAYPPGENEAIVNRVLAEIKERGFWSGEWHNRKKDGTPFYTSAFITQLQVDGTTLLVCVQRDITEAKKREQAIRESEARFRNMADNAPVMIWMTDSEGHCHYLNKQWLHFTGQSLEQGQGAGWAGAVHPEEREAAAKAFGDAGRKQAAYSREFRLRKWDGSYEWVMNSAEPRRDAGGRFLGYIGSVVNLHQRKLAEEELRRLSQHLQLATTAAGVGIWLLELANQRLDWSVLHKRMWGYDENRTDLTYEDWHSIILPEDKEQAFEKVEQARLQRTPYEATYRIKRVHDGAIRWIRSSGQYVYDEKGDATTLTGISLDVTEQKTIGEALNRSEEQFRSLANSIPQLAWMTDADGWIYWYNQRWYDYTGTTLDDMKGWGWRSVHHPDLVDGVTARFKKAVEMRQPWEDTFLLRGKDGRYRWFLSRALPIRNAAGEVAQWFGTNTDISAQRETEQALKTAKEQLELTFRNVPSAIYHFDKDGHLLYLNERGAKQMGFETVEEVLAEKDIYRLRKKIDETFTVLDEKGRVMPVEESSTALAFRTGKSAEVITQFVHKGTGASSWMLSKSAPLFDEQGALSIVLTTTTDITLQKTSEQAIRQSEEKFRSLAETLPQLVWMTDEKGGYEYASGSWQEYTGLDPTDGSIWQQIVHPDDMPGITKAWTESLQTGTTYRAETRLLNKQGMYRWHLVNGEPIRNEVGTIVKWIGAFTDVHEQKTEAERLEAIVLQRTRELKRSNDDLQQFAHVASHDLKEPVRKIRTFGSRLSAEFGAGLPPEANLYLEKIENAATRMYAMIDGVLDYSTVSTAEQRLEQVDLTETIRHIESDLEVVIQQKGATIRYAGLPVVEGSGILLHQLFYNLLNNSLKFSRAGEPPLISINASDADDNIIPSETGLNPHAAYVQITVKDNGIGFSQEQADKIFKTFTRLNAREQYEGTGLGLALCKKIAERHNGTISAAGMEGHGAIFKILLPRQQPKGEALVPAL